VEGHSITYAENAAFKAFLRDKNAHEQPKGSVSRYFFVGFERLCNNFVLMWGIDIRSSHGCMTFL
jgi:hypothetical protein